MRAIAFVALPLLLAGCMSAQKLNAEIERIRMEHGVTVVAGNPLSRCYLFGNLPGLLDRIDSDLRKCPPFFKNHIGPVYIEETFAENFRTYPVPFLVRGYVDPREAKAGFPVHIKNRSVVEKVLFWAVRDDELFLHEASHSFEANMLSGSEAYWREFNKRFDNSRSGGFGGTMAFLACALLPPLNYLRPSGTASIYGLINHWEDFAETHCYLRRRGGDVEMMRGKDARFFGKLMLVGKFTAGQVGLDP